MAATEYQSIYNLSHHGPQSQDGFPQFARLPTELRLQIWRESLRRNRLIRIDLGSTKPDADTTSTRYSQRNSLGKPVTGGIYQATTPGYHIHSKLLRVSLEARYEALRFYRIHIPCYIQDPWGKTRKESILYLNPEYDFLHLETKSPAANAVVDYMFDLKAYDPLDIGLCNLAVSRDTLHASGWLELLPEHLDPPARTAYVETLSQLREVFWVTVTSFARSNAGPLSPIRGVGVRFSDGFPIMTREPVFDRLRNDPRPINRDLEKVIIATPDPRETINPWHQLLANAGVRHRPDQVQYRYLLAQRPIADGDAVFGYEDAERYLEKESKQWKAALATVSGFLKDKAPYTWSPGEADAAFGFWLFPVGSDDKAPLGLTQDEPFQWHRVLDLSNHWPELALSDMAR
ncbi:pectinesterase precursor [Apiospora sp. TS-2023a]